LEKKAMKRIQKTGNAYTPKVREKRGEVCTKAQSGRVPTKWVARETHRAGWWASKTRNKNLA